GSYNTHMQEFIFFFGHGFCHQITERTLESGGYYFSACARDTGIYLGFLFAIVAAFIVYAKTKQKPGDIAPWQVLVVLALFVTPMAYDGLTSYMGLRSTTNTIRYITGAFTGYAAGSLLVPLLFSLTKGSNTLRKIFTEPGKIVIHLLIAAALTTVFFLAYPYLGIIAPLFAIVAFLILLGSINLILITLIPRLTPGHTMKNWLLLLALALALTLIEITLLGVAREAVELIFPGLNNISDILR
ncbi:MAG TPA: hypothetical protein DEB24_03555, partial [Coriobacteriia bacterium]|nr:hypothetical protein [Coriobacteriia bacterium]